MEVVGASGAGVGWAGGGVPAISPTFPAEVVKATWGTVTFVAKTDVVVQLSAGTCGCPSFATWTGAIDAPSGQGNVTVVETGMTVTGGVV